MAPSSQYKDLEALCFLVVCLPVRAYVLASLHSRPACGRLLLHDADKQQTDTPAVISPKTDLFKNSLTIRLSSKFLIKLYLNMPPHLKHVAALPCEIYMFKKSPCARSN